MVKRTGNKRLLSELIKIIDLTKIDVKYKTIDSNKRKSKKDRYTTLYANFIKTLGVDHPIIIDRCDTVKFSNAIINKTKMNNVSWNSSNVHIGIQMADMLLFKKP